MSGSTSLTIWMSVSVAAALIAALVVFVPAFVIAPTPPSWTPGWLRDWAFDARLFLGVSAKTLRSLSRGSPLQRRFATGRHGVPVRLSGERPRLVGSLYRPGGDGPRPGLVLLHGSTYKGRRLGLYRLLASELAARGFVVLAYDQRGYGESDRPAPLDRPESFDYVADVSRAVDFLVDSEGVDSSRLSVVGHSFGADVALAAGLAEPRIEKIVAFAPVRGFMARVGAAGAPQQAYYLRREMRYMQLSEPLSPEVFLAYRTPLTIDRHLEELSREGHKPLLLIEGSLEPREQRLHLQGIYPAIAAPKDHALLEAVDHYANVSDLGPLIAYDRDVVRQLADTIFAFLAPPSSRSSAIA